MRSPNKVPSSIMSRLTPCLAWHIQPWLLVDRLQHLLPRSSWQHQLNQTLLLDPDGSARPLLCHSCCHAPVVVIPSLSCTLGEGTRGTAEWWGYSSALWLLKVQAVMFARGALTYYLIKRIQQITFHGRRLTGFAVSVLHSRHSPHFPSLVCYLLCALSLTHFLGCTDFAQVKEMCHLHWCHSCLKT